MVMRVTPSALEFDPPQTSPSLSRNPDSANIWAGGEGCFWALDSNYDLLTSPTH